MQRSTMGQIIRFPAVPMRSPDRTRLDAAFSDLAQALAAHREAATAWRAALSQLELTMKRLQLSTVCYRMQLDSLNQGVGRLQIEAHRLESWAASLEEFA